MTQPHEFWAFVAAKVTAEHNVLIMDCNTILSDLLSFIPDHGTHISLPPPIARSTYMGHIADPQQLNASFHRFILVGMQECLAADKLVNLLAWIGGSRLATSGQIVFQMHRLTPHEKWISVAQRYEQVVDSLGLELKEVNGVHLEPGSYNQTSLQRLVDCLQSVKKQVQGMRDGRPAWIMTCLDGEITYTSHYAQPGNADAVPVQDRLIGSCEVPLFGLAVRKGGAGL
jgi:hypothetical protein